MTLSLPEVQPVALHSKPEPSLKAAATDVSDDYGTPNLLFLYYIPFLPDDRKPDLGAIRDEFQTWNAWELGQAETQLLKNVQAGNLPSDDSIASRITRNNYRSKAVEFFRAGSQAWLSTADSSTNTKTVEATEASINGAVQSALRSLATENNLQIQFDVILNAIGGFINREKENKLYYSHVYYRYNSDSRTFQPGDIPTLKRDVIMRVLTNASCSGHYFHN
ncbi:hypothetical protein CDD83_3727 [Cordyceps sp. RAO-2017]|nr:hypothetical protein CDD83_3727 [Cordyceps sp. RAO-2017]